MLAIKIEIWPYGDEDHAEEIGRMYVTNDGSGTLDRGNYDVHVCRKDNLRRPTDPDSNATREARVEDYPRKSYNVWQLVKRALNNTFSS
mgnify:CR=1 FL=1